MTPLLQKYATAPVPRYTSYPTVPHFSTGFESSVYRTWLSGLDQAKPISLYLHVPFCKQLCWYCGCNMKLASRYEPISAYVDTLLNEIALVCEALPGRMSVSHLHWGGGTPTVLSPDDLERVMSDLRNRFSFTPDAEIALESDPRTLTEAMTERIGALGFNRASFGVQEFDPKVQAAINRIQPPDMVRKAVDRLRAAGVAGINFDLIYGLPYQTVASLTKTIDTCLDMRPDRIAIFGYAHVPWMAKKQRLIPTDALPGASERAAQSQAAAQALRRAGYDPVGLDHFALPGDPLAIAARDGTLHRNFQGYTTDEAETLIGLGATSIGRTPSGYVQNLSETGAWARAIAAGDLPIGKGHTLSADDRLRAHVIEQLMCHAAVDLDEAGGRFDQPAGWWAGALDRLREMAADGLITLNGSKLHTTEDGLPFVRVVAAAFDQYLQQNKARHAIAV